MSKSNVVDTYKLLQRHKLQRERAAKKAQNSDLRSMIFELVDLVGDVGLSNYEAIDVLHLHGFDKKETCAMIRDMLMDHELRLNDEMNLIRSKKAT